MELAGVCAELANRIMLLRLYEKQSALDSACESAAVAHWATIGTELCKPNPTESVELLQEVAANAALVYGHKYGVTDMLRTAVAVADMVIEGRWFE